MSEERVSEEARAIDRPLTPEEHGLALWMLEHGRPEAAEFIAQLEDARVVGGCSCGCASIDFAIGGRQEPPQGMRILGDFGFDRGEDRCGAFIFANGDLLGGIEVWGANCPAPSSLPKPAELTPEDPRERVRYGSGFHQWLTGWRAWIHKASTWDTIIEFFLLVFLGAAALLLLVLKGC